MIKVKINETEFELQRHAGAAEELDRQVEARLSELGMYPDKVIVDGVEPDEDLKGYVAGRLDEINCIEIRAVALCQFLDKALGACRQYLETAVPEISRLGEDFYKDPTSGTWERFGQMLEGLEWISRLLDSIAANPDACLYPETYQRLGNELSQHLRQLHDAVSDRDMVFTGDLIQYEIAPLLAGLQDTIDQSAAGRPRQQACH